MKGAGKTAGWSCAVEARRSETIGEAGSGCMKCRTQPFKGIERMGREMKVRRMNLSWPGSGLVGALVAVLAVGCVPYATYQEVKRELETAKDATDKLAKDYNKLLQELRAEPRDAVDEEQLKAKVASLQREVDSLRKKPVELGFTPEQVKRLGPGVESEGGGLQLSEALLFDSGSNKLKTGAFKALDGIVELLDTEYPGEMVIIEGHTDNRPLDKTLVVWKENMTLGYERAYSVFKYFVDHGVPESRIVVRSYSFNKPTDPSKVDTKEGQAKNRRVVVRRAGMSF